MPSATNAKQKPPSNGPLTGTKNEAGRAEPASPLTPKAWWQWIILYPTLAVAVVGAVPTFVELARSVSAGVPFGKSAQAKEQQDLWAKNLKCTEANYDGLTNQVNVYVDATICKSGDVLVRYVGPRDDQKSYRWVPVETFDKQKVAYNLIPSAHAQSTGNSSQRPREVLVCQWQPEPGIVVRRFRIEPAGSQPPNSNPNLPNREQRFVCVDETVRASSGTVSTRREVDCHAPPCERQ